ncbi:MAG: hypothetical protein ABFR89_09905 [Actinomycetota bacterium]
MKQRCSGSRTRLPRLMTIALTVFALIGITGPATAAEAAATSDSRTYDVQAVAGFETGLVSLAFIDDRLAAGQPYTFDTWVNTDVEVTLHAYNPIKEAGVRDTFYGVGDELCTPDAAPGVCQPYTGPFVVDGTAGTTVSFYSTNTSGASETKVEPVEVLIDKEPPVMSCSASPEELWAPNNRFIDVATAVTAVDEVSGPADFWLDAIADSYGDADTGIQGFELGEADIDGSMLAKRSGRLGTRVYTLTYASADHLGNTGTCEVTVSVPHDQRRRNSLS